MEGQIEVAPLERLTKQAPTPQRSDFRVLCVDGGGIKGLSAAAVLAAFEESFGSMNSRFDLLCGTSTGGLIALALSAENSAQQIVQFYQEKGRDIFPRPTLWRKVRHSSRMLFSSNKHLYSDVALRRAVKEVVGEKKLRDAQNRLCIPALNMMTYKPRLFKTEHGGGHTMLDGDVLMSDVALATSAAPLYFPIAACGGSYFIDGGVFANNPSLIGLTEALRFFVGPNKPYKSVKLLSIACASPEAGAIETDRYPRWVLRFSNTLLEAAASAQMLSVDLTIQHLKDALCVPLTYHRITISLSPPQAKEISLDTTTRGAIEVLLGRGRDEGVAWRNRSEIQDFFTDQVL